MTNQEIVNAMTCAIAATHNYACLPHYPQIGMYTLVKDCKNGGCVQRLTALKELTQILECVGETADF